MFDDFDDSDFPGDELYSHVDIEESLIKYKQLSNDHSVFFTEEEIEALSYHFFLNNKPKDQLNIVNHGLYLYPNKVDFLVEKASILSLDNNYREGLEVIRLAKSMEPYNGIVHKMEGEILTDLEQYEDAEESFKLALDHSGFEDDDFVIDVYINYAQLLSQTNKLDKANVLIEKALKQYPQDDQLFNQLSMNFISNGQYDKAVSYFKNRIDDDPYSHHSWYHLGRFYELTNKPVLALNAYEYSGLANKNAKNAFFSMGTLFESRNDFEQAIENYKQCFKDSADLYPNICIARCYIALDDTEMARLYLKKSKQMEDMLPEYNYLQGYSFLVDKQPLKALPFFKKVHREDKHDFPAFKGILTCYSEIESYKEMEAQYRQVKKSNPEMVSENWKELSGLFYQSGQEELMDELIAEIGENSQMHEEINIVMDVIRYDQEPTSKNKNAIMSYLIHNFEATLESVKLFCPTMYYEDEEFKKSINIYQEDKDEQ